ncbi:hypothetical protein OSTOST_25346 [Ostertagia ostertagi]
MGSGSGVGLTPTHDLRDAQDVIRTTANGTVKIYIACHNVRTLSSDALTDVYIQETRKIKADVIGVSETRRNEECLQWIQERVLLSVSNYRTVVSCLKSGSPRVAILLLKVGRKRNYEDYTEINEALRIPSTYTIVQGDMNASVGKKTENDGREMGKFGYGERNERGEQMINFSTSNRLRIMNTFFMKPEKRLWTWKSPNGTVKKQIDYVFSNVQRIFQDVSVIGENIIATTDPKLREAVKANKGLKKITKEVQLKQKIPLALKDESGSRVFTRSGMTRICKSFFNKLYSSVILIQEDVVQFNRRKFQPVLTDEVEAAICKIKERKMPWNRWNNGRNAQGRRRPKKRCTTRGLCISPKLFSVVINAVFRNLEWNEGVKIDGETLTHLLYADDCILFATTTMELQRKLGIYK